MSSWVGKQHSGSRDASKMTFHFPDLRIGTIDLSSGEVGG
jgi:hypothetical protein